jgi:hypothetical protein
MRATTPPCVLGGALVMATALSLLACSRQTSEDTPRPRRASSASLSKRPNDVAFQRVPKWKDESIAYHVGSGCLTHMADGWSQSPPLTGWTLEPSARPHALSQPHCHPVQCACATHDSRRTWRHTSPDPFRSSNPAKWGDSLLVRDSVAARGRRDWSIRLLPRHGSSGTDYLGYPLNYWTRSSASGGFLYVEGVFQDDARELSFAVVDLNRRSWRPDLTRLASATRSSAAFASGSGWLDLALSPDETLVAAKPCRRRLAYPAWQGVRSSSDWDESCSQSTELVSTRTGHRVRTLPTSATAEPIAWSPDGERLATGRPLTVWEVRSGEQLATTGSDASALAWIDAGHLATAEATGVFVRDAGKLAQLQRIAPVTPLGLAVDRRSPAAGPVIAMIVADERMMIQLCRVRDGAVLDVWGEPEHLVWFAADGTYDFEGKGNELAGILSVHVRTARRDVTLWSRFWSGGAWTHSGDFAGEARADDALDRSARAGPTDRCDPRTELCSYTGTACSSGTRLDSATLKCIPEARRPQDP